MSKLSIEDLKREAENKFGTLGGLVSAFLDSEIAKKENITGEDFSELHVKGEKPLVDETERIFREWVKETGLEVKNWKRVNTVLTPEILEKADELKRNFHGSRSQAIRHAILLLYEEMNGDGDGGGIGDVDLRHIFEWMEKAKDWMNQVNRKLEKINREVSFLTSKKGSEIEKIADDINELLLERDEALSVPEIADFLDHGESEVLAGVEELEDELVVKRVEQEKGPTKWKAKGG